MVLFFLYNVAVLVKSESMFLKFNLRNTGLLWIFSKFSLLSPERSLSRHCCRSSGPSCPS